MRYSSVVVAASALAGFASAQSSSNNNTFNTPIPCCTVPANTVDSDDRSSWCQANINTCTDLCGGPGNIASNGNLCDDTTLQYTCKCTNGTDAAPALDAYQQSVPAQMCRFWYTACVAATNQNLLQQTECQRARDTRCGNLTISDSGDVSSASASASASATASGSGGAASSAASATASSTPKTGGAASFAQYGAPILAGGLLAAFGIAL